MSSADKRDGEMASSAAERRPSLHSDLHSDLQPDLASDLQPDLASDLASSSGLRRPRLRPNATRSSLALAAQRRLGFSQSESRRLVDDVFSILSDFLLEQGQAKVPSFGSFSVRRKVARVGRNPRTGEVVPIAPRRVVSFRPSPALRERLQSMPTSTPASPPTSPPASTSTSTSTSTGTGAGADKGSEKF